MKIREIKDILNAKLLTGHDQLENLVIAGGAADYMEDILSALAEDSVLLTGVISEKVLQTAKLANIGAIVIVRGKKPDSDFIKKIKSYSIPVLTTQYSMFVACGRLYLNGLRGLDGSW